ncbi:hypothetical protein QO259_17530 [Salinicola sp. JS01]|uniref:hypothetical protein n=1 Tax=Salinicola sp. JS01 TaxID=3050071 RepID=UPI00255B4586|nr:hypothetical protein [Salinicola sp. JS01]WIX32588.1 hypothetical protein QO259_17530 [Salinicola sp. JS01]
MQDNHLQQMRREHLASEGFYSVRQRMPDEHAWVEYDLLFMGQRITGQRRLSPLSLEADNALDPIQAALLLGAGPGIESVYWRPHDPVLAAQETSMAREPTWD